MSLKHMQRDSISIMLMNFLAIGLLALGPFGAKANHRFRIHSMELTYVDPEYYDVANTNVALVDREQHGPEEMDNAVNSKISLVKDIPKNANGHLQVTAFADGEFNKPTGINITVGVCELLMERYFMGPLLNAMGFTKEKCPPGPGEYSQEGYSLANNTVPAIVPINEYLSLFEITVDETPILVTRTIFQVYSPPE